MKVTIIDFVQDVLISIHENIRELNERKAFADPIELTHIEAKIQAYHEFIAILRLNAEDHKIPIEEIGL